jgi:hypothetical protein
MMMMMTTAATTMMMMIAIIVVMIGFSPTHTTGVMKAMPSPAWRRDRYRSQEITQASLQLARYRGEYNDICPMAPLPRDTNCTKSRKILRILLLQCSHGRVIENPAVNRPLLGAKTAFGASIAKMCNIYSARSHPTFILIGETEHFWYF